jgi:hypothetical protein
MPERVIAMSLVQRARVLEAAMPRYYHGYTYREASELLDTALPGGPVRLRAWAACFTAGHRALCDQVPARGESTMDNPISSPRG